MPAGGKEYSKDYAQDIAELMQAGAKGDPGSQGAITELYKRAQADPRILNLMKDAMSRLNENRHTPMKPKDGPIWPRIGELRGEPKAENPEPTEREMKLMGIIRALLTGGGDAPAEAPA